MWSEVTANRANGTLERGKAMNDKQRLTYQERMVLGLRQVFDESCLGRISDCHVQHDFWCGVNSGQPCNCDPDVYLVLPKGRYAVDRQGHATPMA